MTRSANSPRIWDLVARCRPHLTASQMQLIGRVFVCHPREGAELVGSGISALDDGKLAQKLLQIARRMEREAATP
jgi:hypothetical protein